MADQSGSDSPNDGDRRALNERLRQAFLEGAEEQSRREKGRPLTVVELRRVLRRYPGDIAKR